MSMGDERRRSPDLLLIAARAPVPGTTKTRLGASIGMERAARLYRAFLVDLSRRFTPALAAKDGYDLGWAYTPADVDFAAVVAELGGVAASGAQFVPQEGDGWAARQANLLRWGPRHGYERTVLIASDSPHLPSGIAPQTFAALRTADVAIGRVDDGGYYLIGLTGFHDVFTGVPMGTGDAAGALLSRAGALGLGIVEMPPTFDIDEQEDLERLTAALAPDGAAAPATWAALNELGLRPSR